MLERQELTVREIQAAQLPQSTVSAISRCWSITGWCSLQRRYQQLVPDARPGADPDATPLHAVRNEAAGSAAARRDGERLQKILSERHLTAQRFFASARRAGIACERSSATAPSCWLCSVSSARGGPWEISAAAPERGGGAGSVRRPGHRGG